MMSGGEGFAWPFTRKDGVKNDSVCRYVDVDTGATIKEFVHIFSFVPAVADFVTIQGDLFKVMKRNLDYDKQVLFIYVSPV